LCDRLLMCASCAVCLIFAPLACIGALCAYLKVRFCGRGEPRYQETFPQNGMHADFSCEWEPLSGLPPADYERMYLTKAVPPQSRAARSVPRFLGLRGAELWIEMRFADNGQWCDSLAEEPAGQTCFIVAGHGGVFKAPASSDGAAAPSAKVSRKLLAHYQYCVTAFLPADFNWGEQLFEAIQFSWSYRSFGWCRRPIGRRVEEFLGLPPQFEAGSEFYTADCSAPLATAKIDNHVPVAFFYGKSDWMPFRAARLISEKAARYSQMEVPVLLLNHSGHQQFLDYPKGFVAGIRMLVP